MRVPRPVLIAVLLGFASLSFAQSASAPVAVCAAQNSQSKDPFEKAANRWMLAPVDIEHQQDSATADERQARDTYWDGRIGLIAPLFSPNAGRRAKVMVDGFPFSGEFSRYELQHHTWVIGTFESYRTYLSASQRSIYTEISFRVSEVVGLPKEFTLRGGDLITIDRPGGTVLAPWGAVFSFEVSPADFDFQPGHTYLLSLTYVPKQNFYLFYDNSRWDLADGTARPDTRREYGRRSSSSISGLPVQTAVEVLRKKIEEASSKEME